MGAAGGACGSAISVTSGVDVVGSGWVVLWSLKHASEQLSVLVRCHIRISLVLRTMGVRMLDICISLAQRRKRRKESLTLLARRYGRLYDTIRSISK
jgi:hypothetical protein